MLHSGFSFIMATCCAGLAILINPEYNPEKSGSITFSQQCPPRDTFPKICVVLPGPDIAAISPFTIPFGSAESSYEDENGSTCIYRFDSREERASINITLLRHGSAAEAKTGYKNYIQAHQEMWSRDPERIPNLGDSANFSYNADPGLCDICGLTLISGPYFLTINLRGQYENLPREQKKLATIKMAELLMERYPPLRRRN